MINNRQNGRRRGRGGARPSSGPNNGPDRGNRLDNRARGNASQLYEKYKALARDAQMQGDRVNTEYYLQFADHYFRVLSENRARFDEQRRPREDYQGQGDFGAQPEYQDDFAEDGEVAVATEERRDEGRDHRFEERSDRFDRDGERAQDRRGRGRRDDGNRANGYPADDGYGRRQPTARDAGDDNVAEPRQDAPIAPEAAESETARAERPRRGRRPRAENGGEAVTEERIEVDRLPPAFAAEPQLTLIEDAAPAEAKPRRRTRRPNGGALPADA